MTGDNCYVLSVVPYVGGFPINPVTYAFPVGTTIVTWTVSDPSGNSTSCTQSVTVVDDEIPSIACAVPLPSYSVDLGECYYTIPDASLDPVSIGDNCGVASVINNFNGTSTLAGSQVPTGNTTVIWTVTDIYGNESSCQYIIRVVDNENPIITCPADVIVDCEDDKSPANTGTATAIDNCTATPSIVITFADISTQDVDPANPGHYNYTITRTWRATDLAGNVSECDQIITVQDFTSPAITCPGDITIDCEDDSTPTGTGTATATDNCAAAGNITITFTDVSTQDADPANAGHYNYTITRTWRAADPSGNFTTCIQVITVQDVTAPVITCPADITIDCEDDSTPTGTGTATATDNCAAAGNITITFTDVSTQDADPANAGHYNYTITRTWRATDPSSNFTTCIQVITVAGCYSTIDHLPCRYHHRL